VVFVFEALPIPKTMEQPQSITDAIFFVHLNWWRRQSDFFCSPHYGTGHDVSKERAGYWIDRGGDSNKTARLRRLPYRQILCQSIRPEDMLKPEQVHWIEILAAAGDRHLLVDGHVLLSCVEREPIGAGHFGVLGFVRPIRIQAFRVYRAMEAAAMSIVPD